jgi:uncharacterized protein YqfA (UPF0365 family)
VTVRTNLDRFVGGATEETIIARVGEGIVSTIGSADTYKDVLENPDRISKTVLEQGARRTPPSKFSRSTSRTWMSARTSAPSCRPSRPRRTSSSPRPRRKSAAPAAVATEQEMIARVSEMRARVVEAEAQVPMAMARGLRQGNLGIMDYYRMKNIQADTAMRDSIGTGDGPATTAKP